MWATEYHETYTTPLCGREYEPHDDEGTSAIRAYPRLVQRDGSSRVVLKDAEKRSRGFCASTVGATFHTMISWPWWKFFFAFIMCYVVGYFFWGLMIYWERKAGDNDVHGLSDNFMGCMFYAAYTMSTVGYGDTYPENDAGSVIPLMAIVFQIAVDAFWVGVLVARIVNPHPISHTVLFSNRAVICKVGGGPVIPNSTTPAACNILVCRTINLRTKYPWVDMKIRMFFVSWDPAVGQLVFQSLPLDNVPFYMDIPTNVTHHITPRSPLYNLSQQSMVDRRGEVVVELEGYDPLTGGGMKKRFSYISNEIFVNHTFYDVLSLDNNGCYVVNLADFHRTKEIKKQESIDVTHTFGKICKEDNNTKST